MNGLNSERAIFSTSAFFLRAGGGSRRARVILLLLVQLCPEAHTAPGVYSSLWHLFHLFTRGHRPVHDTTCTALLVESPEPRSSGGGNPVGFLCDRVLRPLFLSALFCGNRLGPTSHHLFQLVIFHQHLQRRIRCSQAIPMALHPDHHMKPTAIALMDSTLFCVVFELSNDSPSVSPTCPSQMAWLTSLWMAVTICLALRT